MSFEEHQGFKFKKLRVGFSAAYNFGTRELSTRLKFINDTVIYYKSSTEMQTVFNGLSFSGGLMYDIHIAKSNLRLGVYGNVFNALKARGTDLNQTFVFDGNGAVVPIDTISINTDQKGTVDLPSTFSGGFTWSNKHWLIGSDIEFSNWSDYRFYGEKDATQDIWKLRAGVQYYPASENTPTSKYFQFVKYRLGFYYGPDYLKVDFSNLNDLQAILDDPVYICSKEHRDAVENLLANAKEGAPIIQFILSLMRYPHTRGMTQYLCDKNAEKSYVDLLVAEGLDREKTEEGIEKTDEKTDETTDEKTESGSNVTESVADTTEKTKGGTRSKRVIRMKASHSK